MEKSKISANYSKLFSKIRMYAHWEFFNFYTIILYYTSLLDSKLGNPPSSLGAGKIDESYLILIHVKPNAQIFSFLKENLVLYMKLPFYQLYLLSFNTSDKSSL